MTRMKNPFRKNIYRDLEKRIGYSFRDQKLLANALTHSSFKFETDRTLDDNERLEFLGDSVLGMVCGAHLFQSDSRLREGGLTMLRSSLTSGKTLAEIARDLGLGAHLKLGKGEIMSMGGERPSTLADALEAVIGAAFLDGGLKAASRIFKKVFLPRLEEMRGRLIFYEDNPKGMAQKLAQSRWKRNPSYHVVSAKGPSHAKIFTVKVSLPDGTSATGSAPSKREAEAAAAAALLQIISQ